MSHYVKPGTALDQEAHKRENSSHPDRVIPMLQEALKTEIQVIEDYHQRIEHAEAFGDIGLKVDLENQVADETRHKEEVQLILSGWDRGTRESHAEAEHAGAAAR